MIQDDKSLLQSFVEKDAKVVQLEEMLLQKDVIIKSLKEELFSKTTLNKSTELMQKEEKIKTLSNTLLKKVRNFPKQQSMPQHYNERKEFEFLSQKRI